MIVGQTEMREKEMIRIDWGEVISKDWNIFAVSFCPPFRHRYSIGGYDFRDRDFIQHTKMNVISACGDLSGWDDENCCQFTFVFSFANFFSAGWIPVSVFFCLCGRGFFCTWIFRWFRQYYKIFQLIVRYLHALNSY